MEQTFLVAWQPTKKFIECDLDLLTSKFDLYFSRKQKQCLKKCTSCLTFGRRFVFLRGALKDKFPFTARF